MFHGPMSYPSRFNKRILYPLLISFTSIFELLLISIYFMLVTVRIHNNLYMKQLKHYFLIYMSFN